MGGGANISGRVRGAASRRGRRQRTKPMAEINVTPMVDVMLVLLVIFMVAAPMMTAGVPVKLPETAAGALPAEQEAPLTITITAREAESHCRGAGGRQDLPARRWRRALRAGCRGDGRAQCGGFPQYRTGDGNRRPEA